MRKINIEYHCREIEELYNKLAEYVIEIGEIGYFLNFYFKGVEGFIKHRVIGNVCKAFVGDHIYHAVEEDDAEEYDHYDGKDLKN